MNNKIIRLYPLLKRAQSKQVFVCASRNFASCDQEDVLTHTGQKWDTGDYRLARYMNASKQVNPTWAINCIAEVPPKEVTSRVVWCDGGSGPEGHPRVFINLDKPGANACGYCGLRFIKKDIH